MLSTIQSIDKAVSYLLSKGKTKYIQKHRMEIALERAEAFKRILRRKKQINA